MRKHYQIFLLGSLCLAVGLGAMRMHQEGHPDAASSQTETAVMDQAIVPAESPVEKPRSAITVHIVQEGQSLSEIASSYQIDVDTILGANPGVAETIYPGDQLVILSQKGILHVVNAGETLGQLAEMYGVEMEKMAAANQKSDGMIAVGEKLIIPDAHPLRSHDVVSRGTVYRFLWPLKGSISSPFGERWGSFHSGIDIAVDAGTPVQAARAGKVSYAGWLGGYGYCLIIEHGQGYSTLYGHLADFFVAGGDYVRLGEIIAYSGSTGNSTGPHLHFEVRQNGQPLNPLRFLP